METTVSVAVPAGALWWVACKMLPPKIEFGCPVQRGQIATESFWHVPVRVIPCLWGKIGPATVGPCRIYMDVYKGNQIEDSVELGWGDYQLQNIQSSAVLRRGEPILVPLVFRAESGNDLSAYIADIKFHKDHESKTHPIEAGTNKRRFRLRVKWATNKRISGHFYMIRVPKTQSNSLFSVEVEYEGEGRRSD